MMKAFLFEFVKVSLVFFALEIITIPLYVYFLGWLNEYFYLHASFIHTWFVTSVTSALIIGHLSTRHKILPRYDNGRMRIGIMRMVFYYGVVNVVISEILRRIYIIFLPIDSKFLKYSPVYLNELLLIISFFLFQGYIFYPWIYSDEDIEK